MIFYAKTNPKKTLIQHSIDAGNTAESILKLKTFKPVKDYLYKHCSYEDKNEENFIGWISFMVSIHDIGKCNIKFQMNLDETKVEFAENLDKRFLTFFRDKKFRHEIYSAEIIERKFRECYYSKEWATVVRVHHQKISEHHDEMSYPRMNKFKDIQEKEQNKIIDHLKNVFLVSEIPKIVKFKSTSAWWQVFSGLLILSDWIASAADFVVEPDNYLISSKLKSKELLYQYGLENEIETMKKNSFKEYFGFSDEMDLRPIQKVCETIPKDSKFVLIEAATGECKTEAAIYTALEMCKKQGKSGIFIGLPTSATSNQMYNRFHSILNETGNIKLTHSNAWLLENNMAFVSNVETAKSWMSSTKKAILCQYAVGTVDQAMSSVLRIKHSMLKILGLENKVVILDELHAYDAYMKSIIVRMLEWLRELDVPVIALSATLPDELKKEYFSVYAKEDMELENDYPLVSYISKENELRQISCDSFKNEKIEFLTYEKMGDHEFYASELVKEAMNDKYVVCICNTVASAQKTYNQVKQLVNTNDIDVFILHSKYTVEDRQKIEEKMDSIFSKAGISSRPKKAIVIATQVIEQSLDFDFDAMYSELAPIDLLLQRAGRLKRFGNLVKRADGESSNSKKMTIFFNNDEKDANNSIYYRLLLPKTLDYVRKNNIIQVPNDLRSAINFVYKEAMDREHMMEWMKKHTNEELSKMQAEQAILRSPDKDYFYMLNSTNQIRDYFMHEEDGYSATRLAEASSTVVFLESDTELAAAENDFNKAREIHMRSLSVTSYGREIIGNICIGKGYVKNMIGIVGNEFMIGKKKYGYDRIVGLYHISGKS